MGGSLSKTLSLVEGHLTHRLTNTNSPKDAKIEIESEKKMREPKVEYDE